MRTPGFVAEASLSEAQRAYHMARTGDAPDSRRAVLPQGCYWGWGCGYSGCYYGLHCNYIRTHV